VGVVEKVELDAKSRLVGDEAARRREGGKEEGKRGRGRTEFIPLPWKTGRVSRKGAKSQRKKDFLATSRRCVVFAQE